MRIFRRENEELLVCYHLRSLIARTLSARFSLQCFFEFWGLKKEKRVVVFVVYLRFLSTKAAAMTAMIITTAAPAMSKVSVDMPVPGVGATVGLGATVDVGAVVGVGVIGVGATVAVGCADAWVTTTAVSAKELL